MKRGGPRAAPLSCRFDWDLEVEAERGDERLPVEVGTTLLLRGVLGPEPVGGPLDAGRQGTGIGKHRAGHFVVVGGCAGRSAGLQRACTSGRDQDAALLGTDTTVQADRVGTEAVHEAGVDAITV